MDKEKLIQRLMATFLGELEEHVRALNRDVLALEKDPGEGRTELLTTLFRTAHSLKGAARSVNVRPIEAACHHLESILGAARDGLRPIGPDLTQLLFTAADALKDAGERLRAQRELADAPLRSLLRRLEAAASERSLSEPVAPVTPQPTAIAPGPSASAAQAAPEAAASKSSDPPAAAAAQAVAGPQPEPPARDGYMRVSADKLDALLARTGELLVARRRAASRQEEVSVLHDMIQQCRGEWLKLEKPLRKLLNSNGLAAVPAPRVEARAGARERNVEARAGARERSDVEARAGARERNDVEARAGVRERSNGEPPALHNGAFTPRNGAAAPRNGAHNGSRPTPALPKRALLALERTSEGLKRLERSFEQLASRIAADHHVLEQAASPLEESILRVRMLPFADVCEGLARAVRDLAQAAAKDVELAIEGGGVELDRAVLEQLKDPLLHLVRNAIDHGLETPDERRALGKPARSKLTVAAALRGGGVQVVVADDGRGLDLTKIREQARRRRVPVPDDDREAAQLIFLPGFSTVRIITELSGRGIGLDVVKHRVESLHGHVDFSFTPNGGTRFALTVPLTLTTLRALMLRAGGQVFALPGTSVRRLARVTPEQLASMEGREVLLLPGGPPIPLISLAEVLGLAKTTPERSGGKVPVVVVASGEKQVAFVVDELVAEQELVVKSLGARLRRVRNFAGATVLATGHIALILSAADLVQQAYGRVPARTLSAAFADKGPDAKRRLLIVDDSVTTRSLEKSILEAAGYEVLVAVDGSDAWQLLQERGADLVVADVEMPRLDGFGLCETIRSSKRFRDLPVVLVTALESDRDKAHGLEVGADAYLPKSSFDQRQLLETIAQLL